MPSFGGKLPQRQSLGQAGVGQIVLGALFVKTHFGGKDK
jgi:hypothetical protein